MKHFMKKIMSIILLAVLLVPAVGIESLAAESWPSVSSKRYIEFIADGKISVYTSSSLSTRGTSSPKKAYKAYIASGDDVRIIDIASKYLEISYPTSSGRRTGFIKRSAVLDNSKPLDVLTAKGKAKTYESAGGSSYGSIAKGDKVYVVSSGKNYIGVIYEAKSGSRAYKLGWVKTADFNSKVAGSGSSSSSSSSSGKTSSTWEKKVGNTVADIDSVHYSAKGNISVAAGFWGQCTAYAYGRFSEVHGVKLKTARHAKYWLSENEGDSRVEVLYGADKIESKSIAVRTTGKYGHVMFVEKVTTKNGSPSMVYFTECNADGNGSYNKGKDCIVQRMSYEDFVAKKNPAGYIVAK